MSVIKFELKQEHINLLKNLEWNLGGHNKDYITTEPSGEDEFDMYRDIYTEMGIVLFGKPEGEFDPTSSDGRSWSQEQKETMDQLLEELPMAIQVILYTQSFELGNYKRKYHDFDWKKV